jgi:hypothetical protein
MGRRRKIETFDDFKRALKGNYGVGEGADYTPWLRIQDANSRTGKTLVHGMKTNRSHHLMSALETEFFYIADFSDSVIDIREQFPLFPLNLSQKIAQTFDISHPIHPISKQPLILTTTFLLTTINNNQINYSAISVLPKTSVNNVKTLEKLDIERIWWNELGVPFKSFTGNKFTKCQSRNIAWVTSPMRSGVVKFTEDQVETAISLLHVSRYLKKEICEMFIHEIGIDHDEALSLLLTLIARKNVLVDFNYLIEESGFIDILATRSSLQKVINGN